MDPRNLVVCCDGTWNTPNQQHDGVATPTNVYRTYNAVELRPDGGPVQLKYYHPGVGAEGNWWEKLAGGAFGYGLTRNIMSAYKWLATNFLEGDKIYLFGFSRGAYTVRSLAGMISTCGLLALEESNPKDTWSWVEKAAKAYRKHAKRDKWAKGRAFHGAGTPKQVKIHFLGVWDTVGALGIPNDLAILNLLDHFSDLTFHHTDLGPEIVNARHAVAIDEHRLPFTPTLWTGIEERADSVKQVWFPGVHSDVGGGYAELGLSNGALLWMLREAESLGLRLHGGMLKNVRADPSEIMHESYRGAAKGLKSRPRSMPYLADASSELHESVGQRQTSPPIAQGHYRSTCDPEPGECSTHEVFAAEPWNWTGLYLRAGQHYRFSAQGEWLDWHDRSTPAGLDDGKFQIGDLARKFGSGLGLVERAFRRTTGNDEADIKFTRREEKMPWFALVGSIANGHASKDSKGNVVFEPHETFLIGMSLDDYVPRRSGYLYAYANDAWHMYANNRGAVRLTVERRAS